jgi:hypothetical protein
MTSRTVNAPTSFYFAPDVADLQQSVKFASYMCSAWSFNTDVASAVMDSFRSTNAAGFSNIVAGGSPAQPAPGAGYNVAVSLDNFQARVSAAPGFWSATMNATSEISLRVSVTDAAGNQLLRTIVDGEGSADVSGGCPEGSQAVSDAVAKAVKRVTENYADKVINSGVLQTAILAQPTKAAAPGVPVTGGSAATAVTKGSSGATTTYSPLSPLPSP